MSLSKEKNKQAQTNSTKPSEFIKSNPVVELVSRFKAFNDILEAYLISIDLDIQISKYCINEKRAKPLFDGTPKFFIVDVDLLDKLFLTFINKMIKIEGVENILFLCPSTIESQILRNQLGDKIHILSKQETGQALSESFFVFFGVKSYINWEEVDTRKAPASPENNSTKTILSKREREIAQLIRSGMSSKEMVELLQLSDSTISTYKRRLFDKLQLSNIVQLVELEEEVLFKLD